MKKLFVLLLALTLCLPAFAEESSGISLVPAGTFSPYADFEDDCARVIDTGDTGLEGVFDIQGNQIIPANTAAWMNTAFAATTPCRTKTAPICSARSTPRANWWCPWNTATSTSFPRSGRWA